MSSLDVTDATSQPSDLTEGTLPDGALVDRRYRIVRVIDRGGMATVYEALHTALGKRVAVKVAHPALVRDSALVARMLSEAKTLQAVQHPNVLRVLDCGSDRGQPYIVTELLEGETLRAVFDREVPMELARALSLLAPAFEALACVHDAGLVHRDVKPHNLFVVREGERETLKLLDFGIARSVHDTTRFTTEGALLGTPAYMSPEQCSGERDLTPATDQYSLAVVLYEALTGVIPHDAPTPGLVIAARLSSAAAPLARRRSGLAPAVASVVDRALSRDPSRRFSSITAMREALDVALATQAPRARARHRVLVLVAALAALALGASWMLRRSASHVVVSPRMVSAAMPPSPVSVAAPSEVATAPADARVATPRPAPDRRTRRPAAGDGRMRMNIFREM
jgi:serine/threonine-protein kinase